METTVSKTTVKPNARRVSTGWVLFGTSLILWLASIGVALLTPARLVPLKTYQNIGEMAELFVDGIGFLAFGLVGTVLLNRGNRAGWAYLVPALCYNLGLIAALYAVHGLFVRPLPLAVQATMVLNAMFLPTIVAALVFVPVLYPYGRTTLVWRILLSGMAVLVVLSDLLAPVTPGPANAPDFPMPNPWGIAALKPIIDVVMGITLAAFLGLAVAAAVWTIWRWRKAHGVEKRAYGLFLIGEVIFLAMFLLDNTMQPILPAWSWLAPLIAIPAIPVATYLALLRKPRQVAAKAGDAETGAVSTD